MRRSLRPRFALGVGLAAAAMAAASVAWACTVHIGNVWICPTSSTNCSSSTTQSFQRSTTRYSQARGLYTSPAGKATSHDLRYVSGANANCMTSSTKFGTFTTNTNGNWYKKAIVMPASAGNYTECATWPVDASSPTYASNHANFTVT